MIKTVKNLKMQKTIYNITLYLINLNIYFFTDFYSTNIPLILFYNN